MSDVTYPLTIYYDAACPLCAREMHALAEHDRDGRLQLLDCSPKGFEDPHATAAQVSQSAMMALIHARDAEGRWFRGVEVFVLAYRAVGIEAVAQMWAHPRLRPLWNRLYPWVARHRMGLSRLSLSRPFGWWVAWLARRAQRRGAACAQGACSLDATRE